MRILDEQRIEYSKVLLDEEVNSSNVRKDIECVNAFTDRYVQLETRKMLLS